MYPSHLLHDELAHRRTAALQQAEQARLARLAQPTTPSIRQRWFALQTLVQSHFLEKSASVSTVAQTMAPEGLIECCCPCSL